MMAELEAATCSRSSITNICRLTSMHWFIAENVLCVQDGTPSSSIVQLVAWLLYQLSYLGSKYFMHS
jgi:hypothetical protein